MKMKTEVEMKRLLFNVPVMQKSKSEFLSATDLAKAGNIWRIKNDKPAFNLSMWFKKESTLEFVKELESEYGKVISKGKKTWVHPFLFIDLALAINPKLKIEVYKWLHDKLLSNRNISGDSYKTMCGSLYVHHGDKKYFYKYISKVASEIKIACGVSDWNKATESELFKRDKLHNDISLLSNVLKNNDEAVRLALLQNKALNSVTLSQGSKK